MDFDEPGWQLLDDFFIAEGGVRSAATLRRYARVRDRLTHYLDVEDMAPWLGTHPATLLSAEREFHENGAFWQLFGADELVCALPGFLEPSWMPDGVGEARTQVSLVERLLKYLSRHRLVDWGWLGCAGYEADAAVRQARRQLYRRAEERLPDAWASDMPPRFKQLPGPQW